jgi:hypothetical protein
MKNLKDFPVSNRLEFFQGVFFWGRGGDSERLLPEGLNGMKVGFPGALLGLPDCLHSLRLNRTKFLLCSKALF